MLQLSVNSASLLSELSNPRVDLRTPTPELSITVKSEDGLVDSLPNTASALRKQMFNKCSLKGGNDEGMCRYQLRKPCQLPKGNFLNIASSKSFVFTQFA